MRHFPTLLAAVAAAVLAAACGGGGGSTPAAETTVSGSVVKGPVNGATVSFYEVSATGAKGKLLGTTTTGAGGTYSASVGHAGAILVEATGGTYTDEATGATKPLAETMRLVIDSGSGGGPINGVVTPLTSIAYSLALNGGSTATAAAYKTAVTNIATQFNLASPTVSFVATVPNVSTGTTQDYGRALRAISQYVANGGSLATFLAWSNPASFNAAFSTAYQTANGQALSFSFSSSGVTVGGVSGAGGSGQCGITANVTVMGSPSMQYHYCVSGLPASSCQDGNGALATALSGVASGYGGAVSYMYGPTCASGALPIVLAP